MNKHTPGPWGIDGNLEFTVIENSDTIICQMPYAMTAMQHYANARLIVAAPEMYELLQQVADLHNPRFDGAAYIELVTEMDRLADLAQELLAKIEENNNAE